MAMDTPPTETRTDHSPAPWTTYGVQGDRVRIKDANDQTVCSWPFSDSYCPTWRANQALIEASPELLSACEMMVDDLRERIAGGSQFNPGTMHALEVMERAIAKARGEQETR